jgi:hypothetical protein
MKERERLVVGGLVAFFLILWLGFLVHRSPRFAGSPWGGVLAVSGGVLMLAPLAYMIVKRISSLKKAVTQRVSMRTLLGWHIYAGIVGPILVILHSGHKFASPLGISLTAMTIMVVLSGFTGRYLMKQFSLEIREKKEMLTRLDLAYRETATELAAHPEQAAMLRPLSGYLTRLAAGFFVTSGWAGPETIPASVGALRLAESIADLEYAIKTHEAFKRWFAFWLKFHIAIGFILYVLLALHVWAGAHFGLRWFS